MIYGLGNREAIKNSKEMIIYVISSDYPANVKQVQSSIKSAFGKSIKYNGVYKLIKELVKQGVLEQTSPKEYQLNKYWVQNLVDYSHILSTRLNLYNSMSWKQARCTADTGCLEFDSSTALDQFMKKFEDDFLCEENRGKRIIWHVRHCYYSLLYPESEYKLMKKLEKFGIYLHIVCGSNSPLDMYAKEFYKDCKYVKIKLNSDMPKCESVIQGDQVFEIYYSIEFIKKIDELYAATLIPTKANVKDIFHILPNNKINLVYKKNKDISTHLLYNLSRFLV